MQGRESMKFRLGSFQFVVLLDEMVDDVVGIRSDCGNGLHVLFLDFDSTTLPSLSRKVRKLQRERDLGTCYVFRSSKNNYHAVFLTMLTPGEIVDIQLKLKMKNYLIVSLRKGFWVLRISEKAGKPPPELVQLIPHKSGRPQSGGHRNFLIKAYGLSGIYDSSVVPSARIGISAYTTLVRKRK